MFRLALRVEGRMWNAYAAKMNTMEGAILLGSINMKNCEQNEQRKHAFMALMQECLADAIEDITGVRPVWNKPVDGPDSERGGNA